MTRRRGFIGVVRLACVLAAAHGVAAAQTCRADQLSVTEDDLDADQIDGGAGHHAIVIEIRNRSFPACVLQGAPKLDFRYPDGSSAHVQTCPNCVDYLFQRQPARRIVLTPDESAWVVIGYNVNDGAGACTIANRPLILALRMPEGEAQIEVEVHASRLCGTVNETPFLAHPPGDGQIPSRRPL